MVGRKNNKLPRANERIGQVVSSPRWGVICAQEVNRFRRTLPPAEAELFNECLTRIYRDPRPDRIHKFMLRARPPLVDFMYRDDNFVLIYNWTQFTDPFTAYRVEVFQAARTRDFNEDSTLPRR